MKHPKKVEKYPGTNKELAYDILEMDYSSIAEIFGYFVQGFQEQSTADKDRVSFKDSSQKRTQLASALEKLSQSIIVTKNQLDKITTLCKPYMASKK